MSANEGKLDSVQSYDSEILTAGAMQKTVNPIGLGEFPTQVADFRAEDEATYQELFERCGWSVDGTGRSAMMYYTHPVLTNGKKITGKDLKDIIRAGCSTDTYKHRLDNIPLSVIVHAITDKRYERLQLMDFITRLRNDILPVNPLKHSFPIASYFRSDLGRATALDQHVNRPGHVRRDIGQALDHFFSSHSSVPKDPEEWGAQRTLYELEIIEYYGHNREMARVQGVSVAPTRYAALKSKLG
jgi:hypothetical protein